MSESKSGTGIVQMDGGPMARVTFHPDGTYEVTEILQKAALDHPNRAEQVRGAGELIANMPVGEDGTATVRLT